MTFLVQSTSFETAEAKRAMRVMNRTHVEPLIDYAGCYNCRTVAGSSTLSQHSYGNADDLFPKQHLDQNLARSRIFHAAIYQATHRTIANRGNRLKIELAINHDALLQWTPSGGIQAYGGLRGDHVHLQYLPHYTGPCGKRP